MLRRGCNNVFRYFEKSTTLSSEELVVLLLLGLAATATGAATVGLGRPGVGQHLLLPVDRSARQNVVLVSLNRFGAVVDDPGRALIEVFYHRVHSIQLALNSVGCTYTRENHM